MYAIRIINYFRFEYNGYIIIKENIITGLCMSSTYENIYELSGYLNDNKLYIEIKRENKTIPVSLIQTDYFPKKTLINSVYYSGNSLDTYNDDIHIAITSINDIENTILNKNKTKKLGGRYEK